MSELEGFPFLFSIPEHLSLGIIQKLSPIPFGRIRRTCSLIWEFIEEYQKKIRIDIRFALHLEFKNKKRSPIVYCHYSHFLWKYKIPKYGLRLMNIWLQTKHYRFSSIYLDMDEFDMKNKSHLSIFKYYLKDFISANEYIYAQLRSTEICPIALQISARKTHFCGSLYTRVPLASDDFLLDLAERGVEELGAGRRLFSLDNVTKLAVKFSYLDLSLYTSNIDIKHFLKFLATSESIGKFKQIRTDCLTLNNGSLKTFLEEAQLNFVEVFDGEKYHKIRLSWQTCDYAWCTQAALIFSPYRQILIANYNADLKIVALPLGDPRSFLVHLVYDVWYDYCYTIDLASPVDLSGIYEKLGNVPISEYMETMHRELNLFHNYKYAAYL